jgi:tetratricopeptide (TPR) repeat protein
MIKPTARLISSLIAVSFCLQFGAPRGLAWSPLEKDCKDEMEKGGHGQPAIKNAILRQQAEDAAQDEEVRTARKGQAETAKEAPVGGATEADAQPKERPEFAADKEDVDSIAEKAITEFDAAMKKSPPKKASAEDEASEDEPRKPKTPGHQVTETTLDPEYYYRRAKTYIRDNDLQSALNYINKAMELNPDYWDAWYIKAMIYQMSGKDAAAARRYMELAKRRPDMMEVHIALGILYRKHQNYDLAEQEYKTVIEGRPTNFAAHYNYANLLLDQAKLDQALKEYKLCLKLQPTNAMVHNNVGVIYEKRNFFDEAQEEYTKATHFDPANQKFADNLVLIRAKLGHKPSGVQM